MAKKYKMTRKQLEDKVRQLELEPYEPTPERVEEIKQRAFEMYEREINAKKKREDKKEKKKSRLQRVVVVAALTVAFLVVSFVYNALTPMTVANANSFMKRAVIWINDKLHLGIEFETPIDDESINLSSFSHSYSTIQELANNVSIPIVVLDDNDTARIQKIETIKGESRDVSIAITYDILGSMFRINIKQMFSKSIMYINSEQVEMLETNLGQLTVWQSNNTMKGLLYYDSYEISLLSSLQHDDFLECCQTLNVVN